MLPYSPSTTQPPVPPSPSYPPTNDPAPPPPQIQYTQQEENPPSSKGFLLPLVLIVIILGSLIGVAAFFINNNLNTPKKVKEKVEVVQPAVDAYTRSIKDLSDYLKNESKSDSDSLEREVQKGRSILKTSDDDVKNLNFLIEKLDIKEVQNYKAAINDYLPKAKVILDTAKESVELGSVYIGPLKEIETINLSASGVSNYMYQDPDKYVSLVNDIIQQMSAVATKLEKITPGPTLKDYHEAFVKTYKQQIELLTEVRNAVMKRSQTEITNAQKKYIESSQNQEKEINRVSDIIDEKIDEMTKEAESYQEKITSEYNRLRGAYNF